MKRRPRRERLFVCECWRLQAGTAITSFAVASSSVTSREARLDCFFAAPPGWRRAVARNGRPLFGQSHRMKERRSLWEFEAALLGRGPELAHVTDLDRPELVPVRPALHGAHEEPGMTGVCDLASDESHGEGEGARDGTVVQQTAIIVIERAAT